MAIGGPFDTFPKLLLRNAAQFGSRPAFRHKDLGIWQTWTWSQIPHGSTGLVGQEPDARSTWR